MVSSSRIDSVLIWNNLPELKVKESKNDTFSKQKKSNNFFNLDLPYTLAPIWFPHCPAWRWTISRILRN